MTKFLALYDIHWGYEYTKSRHKRPIHDIRAINTALQFAADFKPDIVVLGGDILDCGAVSHHNKHKPGNVEGLRIISDMLECAEEVIVPLEKLKAKQYYYIIGNHEDWLNDVYIETPALEGALNIKTHMLSRPAGPKWNLVPQGGSVKLGKLTFIHGDTLKGNATHIAKQAYDLYSRNVRFGHFHTYQVHTPKRALDMEMSHTAVAVPCLCRRDPVYNEGKPNPWLQGFNYGYVNKDGTFSDYVAVLVNGKVTIGGKVYGG